MLFFVFVQDLYLKCYEMYFYVGNEGLWRRFMIRSVRYMENNCGNFYTFRLESVRIDDGNADLANFQVLQDRSSSSAATRP